MVSEIRLATETSDRPSATSRKRSKSKRKTKIGKMIKSTIKIRSRIPDSVCRETILIARADIPRTVPHLAFWRMPAVK